MITSMFITIEEFRSKNVKKLYRERGCARQKPLPVYKILPTMPLLHKIIEHNHEVLNIHQIFEHTSQNYQIYI